jgi:hypothetical protein
MSRLFTSSRLLAAQGTLAFPPTNASTRFRLDLFESK